MSSRSHSCMSQAASFRLVPHEEALQGLGGRAGFFLTFMCLHGRRWQHGARREPSPRCHACTPVLHTWTPPHLYLHTWTPPRLYCTPGHLHACTWTPARLHRGTASSDLAPCRAPRCRGVQHHIGLGISILLTCTLSLDRFGPAWHSLLLHPSPSGAAVHGAASGCRWIVCSAQLPAEVGGPRLPQVAWEREEKLNASNPLGTEEVTSL